MKTVGGNRACADWHFLDRNRGLRHPILTCLASTWWNRIQKLPAVRSFAIRLDRPVFAALDLASSFGQFKVGIAEHFHFARIRLRTQIDGLSARRRRVRTGYTFERYQRAWRKESAR